MRARLLLSAVLLLTALSGCGGSSAPRASGASSSPDMSNPSPKEVAPTVSTTLAGLAVLPHRIHWIVTTSDDSQVSQVRFLIDGQLGWVEKVAPFVYGDDGNWLVTSFLKPGSHMFAAEVTTVTGGTVTDTVKATVTPPVAPPSALAGSWHRTVTAADVKKATSDQAPPAGRWGLRVDSLGWHMTDPQHGGGAFDVGYLGGSRLDMRPTIEMPPYPNASNGGFCGDTDPAATWQWSTGADTALTLAPVGSDACGDRAAILQGTWQRGP